MPASDLQPAPANLNPYDETPYPSASFSQTHPNKLAAMARLFGVVAADPMKARVLELGCADGSNLLPMAEQCPDATFIGIDSSRVQIEAGQKALAAGGLKNVELRQGNILEFPGSEGRFDYIIAHGVFSWVSDAVREKLFRICSEHLTENGVAYISYNALPGWNMRRSLRDMMLFHTASFTDPVMKVQQSRALLHFLSESVPTENNAYGMLLKSELAFMGKQMDNYLRHDILEEENTPFYFHEFLARAARHGLQYLSEPSLSQMLAANFPEKVRQTLTQLGHSIVAQEQYMDFLRNRTFRQTLLCRAKVPVQRNLNADGIGEFAFQSLLKPAATDAAAPASAEVPVDLAAGVAVTFGGQGEITITSSDPFVKAALQSLAGGGVCAVAYADLLADARRRSRPFLGAIAPNRDEIDEATLKKNLMDLYAKGVIDLFATPVRTATVVPEKPALSALTRHQAFNSRMVTNRMHQPIPADLMARCVIDACDGTRTREEILDFLVQRVDEGKLELKEGDQKVGPGPKVKLLLAPLLDTVLLKLTQLGFFAA